MATTHDRNPVKIISLILAALGLIMVVAGGVTWGMVSSQLAEERITVAKDASMMAEASVTNPLAAYAEAEIIKQHALKATGGKTFAELSQDDPKRATAMNASFLRASLFTSVIAFGVAFFAIGMGIVLMLIAWALRKLGVPAVSVVPVQPAPAQAAPAGHAPAADRAGERPVD